MPPPSPAPEPILAAAGIIKRFPGVVALKGVTFDVRRGEIHALCGENGAGKSTLIKVLSGLHPFGSYEGEIRIANLGSPPVGASGEEPPRGGAATTGPLQLHHVRDAERAGISVIYQELALVEEMTVAENIFLGHEPRRGPFLDGERMHREAHRLLDQFRIAIDPAAPVSQLGVGQKQLVEIVKALAKQSRVLILDEPTAALAETEVAILLDILRGLRAHGMACIYISHKLDEVLAIADRITVLRDGESVATLAAKDTDKALIIRHMVGREITDYFPRRRGGSAASPSSAGGCALLEVRGLNVARERGEAPFLCGIDLTVHAGEVLGIGGLMGSGRTELLMHLLGAWGHRVSGAIELEGVPFRARQPDEAIAQGLVLVSEDRKRYGLVLEQSIGFNLSLSAPILRHGLLDAEGEFRRNGTYIESLRIRAPGQDEPVGRLSGGNQQKVVLGKALTTSPRVVLLDEPTRGIDVGAKIEVYELINRLTAAGQGVVLVSSEMPELLGMSDRIVMLHEGRVAGEFKPGEAKQEDLLAAAMGLTPA